MFSKFSAVYFSRYRKFIKPWNVIIVQWCIYYGGPGHLNQYHVLAEISINSGKSILDLKWMGIAPKTLYSFYLKTISNIFQTMNLPKIND